MVSAGGIRSIWLWHNLEEIQPDLDEFMTYYNTQRTNQGRYCQGRTPMQMLLDGRELCQKYVYDAVDDVEAAV